MPPLVPGFTVTGELSSDGFGSRWAAVRNADDTHVALRILQVNDVTEGQAKAAQMNAVLVGFGNQHLVRQHGSIALAGGELALVFDQVTGGSLDRLLGDRGHLTTGETVTTLAPLFGALADLHAVGVVHGELAPATVLFSADGRPMIGDLGVGSLLVRASDLAVGVDGVDLAVGVDGVELAEGVELAGGFVAPEVVAGAPSSAASDVYSMGALGWYCRVGAPPAAASERPSLSTLSPGTPARMADVLTACLSPDPAARPSAGAAAIEVFDSAPAESVILTSAADPATEITRRIRATALPPVHPPPPSNVQRVRRQLAVGAVALLVAVASVAGAAWFLGRSRVDVQAVSVHPDSVPPASVPPASLPPSSHHPAAVQPKAVPSQSSGPAAAAETPPIAPTTAARGATDVVTARDSPRTAPATLLQELVDARALAYAARNPVLLDLVYAPGAPKAGADRANLATALESGATYLGLAFVVKDAAFLDGTATAARILATIVTPGYQTGQPDGRKIPHAQESVGPSVFTLGLTRDGWRILALTAP